MGIPRFEKAVVAEVENDVGGSQMNTFIAVGDLNADGRPDIVVSGRNGRMVWIENTGGPPPWPVHLIAEVEGMECGGCLWDLTGNGYLDVINGGDGGKDEIWWWENPGPAGGRWTRRVIAKTGNRQFHDTVIGEAGDGRRALLFTNQGSGTTVYRVPLPADPTVSPWPEREIVAAGMSVPRQDDPGHLQPEEGIAAGDLDGDGVNEVVSGTHWYKRTEGGWQGYRFARPNYVSTKVAIGDLDRDGRNEIVLSEGDPLIYGKPQGGKLAWFKPAGDETGPWQEHVLADGLFDAHSLQLADLCGSGRLDILTAEIGKPEWPARRYVEREPRVLLFENLGAGEFREHVIDRGTGAHDAVAVDMDADGRLDIVSKPLHGEEIWHVHVWFNRGGG
jgi:hypothetical protein